MQYLNFDQLVLHHRKNARNESEDEFEYITEYLVRELFDKVNELIEQANNPNGLVTVSAPVEHFWETDESLLVLYPGYLLDPTDVNMYDVVFLPDLYPFIDTFQSTLEYAYEKAKKRIVFGYYKAPDQDIVRLERWLTSRGWEWLHDESEMPTYVIDKDQVQNKRPTIRGG